MLLYEGKAKQVYSTENENEFIVYFKDDATAFNGEKKAQISSKGILNNKISTIIFEMLHEKQIKTHFVKKISEREMLVKKVEILPLEVIVRNITAGSFCKRYGVEEGIVLDEPIFELSYKNDAYGDPMLNDDHAVAMKLATREELQFLRNEALKINEIMNASNFNTLLLISNEFIKTISISLPPSIIIFLVFYFYILRSQQD